MKNLFYISLSVLFGVFLIVASCKKDPDPVACTSCQKVTEAKDYFAFKVGTWWVYEEETTNERDSVYVTQSSISGGYDFETYVYSSYQDYYYHFSPLFIDNLSGCSEYSPVSKKCLYVIRSKQKPGDFVGSDYCLFFAHKKNDFIYISNVAYPEDKLIIDEIYNEYHLGIYDYQKTIKIHELNTFIENKQETNHFFSKGIGLIRKELLDSNQVWNLVNYHIEP